MWSTTNYCSRRCQKIQSQTKKRKFVSSEWGECKDCGAETKCEHCDEKFSECREYLRHMNKINGLHPKYSKKQLKLEEAKNKIISDPKTKEDIMANRKQMLRFVNEIGAPKLPICQIPGFYEYK